MEIKNAYSNLALLAASFLIIAIIFILYYSSLNYDLMWDDFYYFRNVQIQKLSWENIKWMLTTLSVANWHPLTWLSFAIDYAWQGSLKPFGFHLTNTILHCLNSAILFFLTSLLLNIIKLQSYAFRPRSRLVFYAALMTALLFGIHPQHIESVVWISERKDVLCLFFLLLTVCCYIFYVRSTIAQWYWFLFSIILYAMALMSKPMAVTLPVILLLLDVYPFQRTALVKNLNLKITPASFRRILIEKIPFFALSINSIVLTLIAQDKAIISIENFSLFARIINAIHSVFLYMSKFILPIALSPLYQFPVHIVQNLNLIKVSVLTFGFISLTVLSIYFWKNKKFILISWFFYLITLSPMSGIIQVGIQSAADRYAYLPTIPFYIIISFGVVYLYYKPRQKFNLIARTMIIFSVTIIGLILFKLSQDQLYIWKHGVVLWRYVVNIYPSSGFAHHNLAAHYFEQGYYQEALEHTKIGILYGNSLRRESQFLGEIYIRINKLDEALFFYQHALKTDITLSNYHNSKDCAFYNIGWIYASKGLLTDALQSLNLVPKSSQEFTKTQELIIKVAMLDFVKNDNFSLKQIPPTTLFPGAEILYQAKLYNLLSQKKYSFCGQDNIL